MTILEAINITDSLKHNTYEQSYKVGWLSQLDWKIFNEIIKTHEGHEGGEFVPYDETTDLANTELLIAEPYCGDVYNNYLQMLIDRENGEIGKYNQSAMLFNAAYQDYCNWYNRTHMPMSRGYFHL